MSAEPRRRALVTGASGGLGSAISARLAADGFEVAKLDLKPPADFVLDLRSDPLPSELAEFDVCISNAGVVDVLSPAHQMSIEKWERDVSINLTGSFRVVQACLRGMRERRHGRIVAMSSVVAVLGAPGQVAYGASKAGLLGMVKAVAAENAGYGITANAVLPGVIETENVRRMPDEVRARALDRLAPLGRFGRPSEVAALVAFLVSEDAAYVTGQGVVIDGGSSLNTTSFGREGP